MLAFKWKKLKVAKYCKAVHEGPINFQNYPTPGL